MDDRGDLKLRALFIKVVSHFPPPSTPRSFLYVCYMMGDPGWGSQQYQPDLRHLQGLSSSQEGYSLFYTELFSENAWQ